MSPDKRNELCSMIDKSVLDELGNLSNGSGRLLFFSSVFEIFQNTMTNSVKTLDEAYDANNGDAVKSCAHRIKGSCGNLGAVTLADDAIAIEKFFSQDAPDFVAARSLLEQLKEDFEKTLRCFASYIAEITE